MQLTTQPARRDHDDYGRRIFREGEAPHMVLDGFKIATADWIRTEDGWECEYEFSSHTIYPTAEECWAAIRGEAPVQADVARAA